MPKRGGRSRGGSRTRGSRGGSRGGGSFNLSKSLKRRANRNKTAARARHDVPELMDLESSEYLPEVGGTMHSLSKRPNRRMMAEAQYTDKHLEETMSQPLRYRRIEFVKAQSVYDPGKELIEQMKKYVRKDDLAIDLERLNVQSEFSPNNEQEPHGNSFEMDDEGDNASEKDAGTVTVEVDNEQEMSEDSFDGRINSHETIQEIRTSEKQTSDDLEPVEIYFSDIDSGTPEVNFLENGLGNIPEPLKSEFLAPDSQSHEQDANGRSVTNSSTLDINVQPDADEDNEVVESSADEIDEKAIYEFFTIDETGDDDVYSKHAIQKKSTHSVLSSRKRKQPIKNDYADFLKEINSSVIDHDPYLLVGKVMLHTLTDQFGNISASLPRSIPKGPMTLEDFLDSYYEEESEDTDEEAAFEDYKAQIMGSLDFDDEGFDDDIDDGEDLTEEPVDYAGADSFDYGDNGGLDTEGSVGSAEIDDYDVYVSSDKELGENEKEDLNSDEEGLEDILAFARQQQKVKRDFDLPPTQTLKKKGRGRKQRLELGPHLELELRESLMEQFQYQKKSRKEKKLRKQEKRRTEGIEMNDLKIKYDYSLHIKEIKDEFESFLHDLSRETMSFPPLDGHGNKTINKLAGHYNMKCIRCGGNGLSLFMKVAKTKKTFRYLPAYDQIGYIMKQRPVFRRVDVKPRTKEEVIATDGKKDSRVPQSTAMVKEGDIVGGKAPEIGNNNIGRQLLERLGWIKGEGLGALGNKGISEPLIATVKRSKTGLK